MNLLELKPQVPTRALMAKLEKKGLILWLSPDRHALRPAKGSSADKRLYASEERWGPHMVISVTCNRPDFPKFGTHPDNEEFLMVGDPKGRPLYLVIAWHKKEVLQGKIDSKTLRASDFVALKIRFNDPETAFFTMLKDTPHGEAAAQGTGKAPSFYVTEARDLSLEKTDLKDYILGIQDKALKQAKSGRPKR